MPDVQEFLRLATDRLAAVETFEAEMRKEAKLDWEFRNLEQWDKRAKNAREAAGKHALVIDQIGEPLRQLIGQQRQARPAIQVSPVDSGADIDTAEVYQAFTRHIESVGGAKPARDTAFASGATCGWGDYRILLEWEYDWDSGQMPQGPEAFDQCITYQPIEDPFTVYRDPATPLWEPWKMRYCFQTEDIPKSEFLRRWPGKITTASEAFALTGRPLPDWYPETGVRVADYFYVEDEQQPEIAKLADGTVVLASAIPPGAQVIERRVPTIRKVKLAKISGAEILEGNADLTAGRDWPGAYIPFFKMFGEALIVDGKRILRGLVRPARDLCRAYNYNASELMGELADSPKSKVLMPNGAQVGHETQWKEAARKTFPYLLYEPQVMTAQGGILQTPEPKVAHFTDSAKIQALVIAIQQLKADLRTVTGWYDATDPSRRNSEQSGRAVLARKESQAEGSVNYKENFGVTLMHEALVLMDLIPKVYNRPGRVLRLIGDEGEEMKPVQVGGEWQKPKSKTRGIFQWGAGRYDVVASVGASYLTRRQEATDQGLELMKILPPQMQAVTAPTVVANMDMPGSKQLAEKLKKTLPPELQDEQDQPQIPPQVQQQLKQAEMVIQALTKELDAKNDLIEKEQLSLDSAERIKAADNETKIRIAAMDNETKLRIEEYKVQAQAMQEELDAAEARLTMLQSQAHEVGMAGATGDREAMMAERGQMHERDMAERGHEQMLEQQAMQPSSEG